MLKDSQKNNFKYRNILIQKATKEELILKKFLEDNKIRFLFQKGFLKPFHRIVDFYIPRRKVIIEVDGDYHKEPIVELRDLNKDIEWLWDRGMTTIRITNKEINNKDFSKLNKLST